MNRIHKSLFLSNEFTNKICILVSYQGNIGISVHMGTMWVLWASRGGQNPVAESKKQLFIAKSAKIEQKS